MTLTVGLAVRLVAANDAGRWIFAGGLLVGWLIWG